ncbi:MAG: glycosyltransferase family 2 protein [Saccharofermentans sp.]|nr:glycosyltransferase family 2 protein [Saccharofermentans sp.]
MVRIGFVILTWNSEKVIDRCLNSIVKLKQIKPYVVVVDNGSVDNTNTIVDEYSTKYPDAFKLIRYKANRGTTVSRNAGIRALSEFELDYYCILDSDTIISDGAFLKLAHEMNSNPSYGIIGPKMVSSSGVEQMSARAFPTLIEKLYKALPFKSLQKKGEEIERQLPPNEEMESYPVDYLMSACWLIRPQVIHTAGLLDEKLFYAPEDAEYCICVWKSGYQVAFCSSAQITHEWQRLSKKKLISKINYEHIKGLIYMFWKHQYLFSTAKLKKTFNGDK